VNFFCVRCFPIYGLAVRTKPLARRTLPRVLTER
jgi:hypothetical protein